MQTKWRKTPNYVNNVQSPNVLFDIWTMQSDYIHTASSNKTNYSNKLVDDVFIAFSI